MPITRSVSSRSNAKQLTGADVPQQPTNLVTNKYVATSTASQTTIALTFAVDQNNKNNFILIVNGKILTEGASNDFTFTNIQPNNTSSQITLASALTVGLNIVALWLGIAQSNYSLATLTASVNANTSSIPKNLLLNGNFDLWQRGTSVTIANGGTSYQADRWYAKNSLGTNGVLTYSQRTGENNGALFGAKVQITTAPTAAQANGTELWQVLENVASMEIYNQVISASAQIKAFGNVNQIGIQFFYATSEIKPTLSLGSETLTTVNSSTFTLATVLNQSVGTLPTTAGVVAIRIRITGVSSGNTYDLNNGFVVEQAKLNIGSTAANFSKANNTFAGEILACQRFFFKTYPLTVAPGSVDSNYPFSYRAKGTASGEVVLPFTFPALMRGNPASIVVTVYSPGTGATGKLRNLSSAVDINSETDAVGSQGAYVSNNAATVNGSGYAAHITAEAEI